MVTIDNNHGNDKKCYVGEDSDDSNEDGIDNDDGQGVGDDDGKGVSDGIGNDGDGNDDDREGASW